GAGSGGGLRGASGSYAWWAGGGAGGGGAGVFGLPPPYYEVAPLIHLAGAGLMLDWPNWMGGIMLRRELNFRRLQVLNGVATFVSLGVTLGLGVAGAGAYALVLGGNVARPLPFGTDLLIVRGWRPAPGWAPLPARA